MACFLVAATEAVITTVATKIIEKKEKEQQELKVSFDGVKTEAAQKIPFSRKLKWLNRMLWGGSALLMFEHIWHGEIVPFFPFLTAASDPADAAQMMHEMATVGVSMAALVTAVWLGVVGVTALIEKRAEKEADTLAASEG
ncbi:hypothetical protein [uncultured Ruminococcus sp.]|uniref:hypothetical protein n=1 Tax=uncultured Ruminococcus sp. TaxID=165186 RepID=UPI002931D1F6|nr:hypothetical protein [uncultured Ruminococcus sp.]